MVDSSLCWCSLLSDGNVIFLISFCYSLQFVVVVSIFSETSNQEIYFFFTLDWLADGICSVNVTGENTLKYHWMRFHLDFGNRFFSVD